MEKMVGDNGKNLIIIINIITVILIIMIITLMITELAPEPLRRISLTITPSCSNFVFTKDTRSQSLTWKKVNKCDHLQKKDNDKWDDHLHHDLDVNEDVEDGDNVDDNLQCWEVSSSVNGDDFVHQLW